MGSEMCIRDSPPCYTQLQRLSQCRTAALRQVHLPQQPRSRASGYQSTSAKAAHACPEAPQDAVGASPSTSREVFFVFLALIALPCRQGSQRESKKEDRDDNGRKSSNVLLLEGLKQSVEIGEPCSHSSKHHNHDSAVAVE